MRVICFTTGRENTKRGDAVIHQSRFRLRQFARIKAQNPPATNSKKETQLQRQGYYKAFPPEGVEVVSWYVMMGIGQVVTLRLPASRLREVNRILENTAWGSYRTEFYPTYDYKAIGIAAHEKAQ